MERRAFVLALALTLPLVLYGIPYAYASQTTSTIVRGGDSKPVECCGHTNAFAVPACSPGEVATGGGYDVAFVTGADKVTAQVSRPAIGTHDIANPGDTPTGWFVRFLNTGIDQPNVSVYVICQIPTTVAGIGVPQFGSLYVAIVLGAVAYFMLSRRFTGRRTITTRA
jgi:hypothetical protein